MKPVVIFGAGTFAQVIAEYLGEQAVAYTIDARYIRTLTLRDKPIVPFEELTLRYPPKEYDAIVAVTQQNTHRDLMERKMRELWEKEYATPSFVHHKAIVDSTVGISQGCVVSPGAIIEPFAVLGNGVVVRSGAYVGHHCYLNDFCYVAPRASMSGHVTVGGGAFIGNNATIRDRVVISHHAVIGAGAVVLRDVKPDEVYQGYPARLLSVKGDEVEI